MTTTALLAGRVLAKADLRKEKPDRDAFLTLPRRPITVVLDGIKQNYNIGAIFRLCDAFLVERLVICGTTVNLRKRKLVQAACGTQHWVPWEQAGNAIAVVSAAKAAGAYVVVAEQTTTSITPDRLAPLFPAWLVLGSERHGLSQEIIDLADVAVAIPMLGLANSINVASAAATLLHQLALSHEMDIKASPKG
jgi:tRNA G18 (ribose-2'-O)-methylase SpoU